MEKNESVNLRNIFREKNPELAKLIPGFVYSWLNRILHIQEINDFMALHGSKEGLEFTEAVISEFNITATIRGEENLPDIGRFFFVSNHPLGGFDGLLLITLLGRKYKDIKSLSNDILMNVKNMKDLFLPVNKHGGLSHEAVKNLGDVMASEAQILSFPAGLVSRKKKGIIRDTPWKKSFISKAIQYQRDVIPIHVSGRCTNFFYRIANLRKFLRIKSNLEMFFLPDETFRHRNEHITITIGKPVSYKVFDKSRRHEDWALSMQNYVYSLALGNEKDFDSNY